MFQPSAWIAMKFSCGWYNLYFVLYGRPISIPIHQVSNSNIITLSCFKWNQVIVTWSGSTDMSNREIIAGSALSGLSVAYYRHNGFSHHYGLSKKLAVTSRIRLAAISLDTYLYRIWVCGRFVTNSLSFLRPYHLMCWHNVSTVAVRSVIWITTRQHCSPLHAFNVRPTYVNPA